MFIEDTFSRVNVELSAPLDGKVSVRDEFLMRTYFCLASSSADLHAIQ